MVWVLKVMVALEVEGHSGAPVRFKRGNVGTRGEGEVFGRLQSAHELYIGSGSVSEIGLGHCHLAGSCQVSRELRTRRGRARGQKTESWGEIR